MLPYGYPRAYAKSLAFKISYKLRVAYAPSKHEPQIVRDFANAVNGQRSGSIKVRAAFVHQKPVVTFLHGRPHSRKRCELGDILFIAKVMDFRGRPVRHKSSLVQVKKDSSLEVVGKRSPHQLELYSRPRSWPFTFRGKRWQLEPMSMWYAHFLFISGKQCSSITSYIPPPPPFRPLQLALQFERFTASMSRQFNLSRRISLEEFLQGFIPGERGENLLRNRRFRDLVDEIYAHCKIVPDPPEVEEEGFAIVEFISTSEQGESKIR